MTKINIQKEIDKNTMMSHIILSAISSSCPTVDILEHFKLERGNLAAEVKIVINGVECDLQAFCDTVESQIDRMVKEEAETMIGDMKTEINDKVDGMIADMKTKLGLRTCTCFHYED